MVMFLKINLRICLFKFFYFCVNDMYLMLPNTYLFNFFIYFNMRYLSLIIKGFVIGIAKIIPGVSGAILAISFGIYERLLLILSNLRKITIDDLKFLLFLLIGACLGITFFCKGVKWCLEFYYFPTMLLFIGLIIGGMPEIYEEIKKDKFCVSNFIIFLISFLILVFLANFKIQNGDSSNNYFIYFIMGILEACTTIIPGISGTAIFMAFGWYNNLLSLFEGFSTFNFEFGPGISFLLGVVISAILLAKLLTYLFENFKVKSYFSITGFMIGSLFVMIQGLFEINFSLGELLIGILLFIVGLFLTNRINSFFSKL